MSDDDDKPDLGPCCICETRVGVTNVLMLGQRAPVPGTGWGCIVCGLPSDGAVAVLCDGCLDLFQAGAPPLFVCSGFAPLGKRVPITELPFEKFEHDDQRHREDR